MKIFIICCLLFIHVNVCIFIRGFRVSIQVLGIRSGFGYLRVWFWWWISTRIGVLFGFGFRLRVSVLGARRLHPIRTRPVAILDPGRSRVITCHSWEIENILLLLLSWYYHIEQICIIIRDQAGLGLDGLGLGWAIERGSVVFVPSVSIKDRLLHWTLVRSQTYYPEHILAYMSGKTCYSIVMGSSSFWTDCYDGLLGRRSKYHTEVGPAVLGAWGSSLNGDLDPVTGVKRVGLVCARGTNEACVFRGTHLSYIDSWIDVSTWRYNLATV
jgi:hypothetical protein